MHLAARLAPVALLAAAACSDYAQPAPGPGQDRRTHVLLTDGPFPYELVRHVDVYIVSVAVSTSAGGSDAGFVTVATPERRFDLLALENGATTELGAGLVPAGTYRAVRMVIDADSSSITLRGGRVLTAATSPGITWQPSAGRQVLNAVVHEPLVVPTGGALLAIDFDVGQSLFPQGGDTTAPDFIVAPWARVVDANRAGAVSGTVASGAGAVPVADASVRLMIGAPGSSEDAWTLLSSVRTSAVGAFRLAYLTPSAHWEPAREYVLVVDPPRATGFGRVVVAGVDVRAGLERSVGNLVLP